MIKWIEFNKKKPLVIRGDGKHRTIQEAFEYLNSQDATKNLMRSLANR